jgi:hypothetical protein
LQAVGRALPPTLAALRPAGLAYEVRSFNLSEG